MEERRKGKKGEEGTEGGKGRREKKRRKKEVDAVFATGLWTLTTRLRLTQRLLEHETVICCVQHFCEAGDCLWTVSAAVQMN